MTTPLIMSHPVPDYSGTDKNYYVGNEQRNLLAENARVIVPHSGPFYRKSLVVIDNATGQRLVEGKDFRVDVLENYATEKSRQEVVCTVVFPEDRWPTLPSVTLKYQFVGGPYHPNISGLEQAVNDLETRPDVIYWDNILGKPVAYPPSYHTHHAKDITHLDNTNDVLRAINQSIIELAKKLTEAKVPNWLVTYDGASKYTIDEGVETDIIGNKLLLAFPRGTHEDGRISLNAKIYTDQGIYNLEFVTREAVAQGFAPNSSSLYTNLTRVTAISSARLVQVGQTNYLELTASNNFPRGYYIVKDVTVRSVKPVDYCKGYQWLGSIPSGSGHPEANVPIVNTDISAGAEQFAFHKINVDKGGYNINHIDNPITLKFPLPVIEGEDYPGLRLKFKIEFVRNYTTGSMTIVIPMTSSGRLSDVSVYYDQDGDEPYLVVSKIATDVSAGVGYVGITASTGIFSVMNVSVTDVMANMLPNTLNTGWTWVGTDVVPTQPSMTVTILDNDSLFKENARSYTHRHAMGQIIGLPEALSAKVDKTTFEEGTELSVNTDLDQFFDFGHYKIPVMTAAQLTAKHYPVIPGFPDTVASKGSLEITKLDNLTYQTVHCTNGYSFTRSIFNHTASGGDTTTIVSLWGIASSSRLQYVNCVNNHYTVNLTTLDRSKYYLLEVQLTGLDLTKLRNRAPGGPIKLNMTYNPDDAASKADGTVYGSVFGEIIYGANSNLGTYYNLVSLFDGADDSLWPFKAVYTCPVDKNTDIYSVWFYVRGSGTLNMYTDAEAVVLHTASSVKVGTKGDGSAVNASSGVAAPVAIGNDWKQLFALPPNAEIKSLAAKK